MQRPRHGRRYSPTPKTTRWRASAAACSRSGMTRSACAVVIASASLPELDPAQFCRDVRAAARNVYVLLLLDGDTKEAIELAFEAGADDVLPKSIGEAE